MILDPQKTIKTEEYRKNKIEACEKGTSRSF
jgi:hypothetical protein